MLLMIQNPPVPPARSKVDVTTVQADFKAAIPGTHYNLNADGTVLTKIGAGDSSSRCFEVTGKPRPGGKYFMRLKVGPGSNYAVVLISNGLVNANNQLAWTSGSLAPNVWHEIRVEHISGSTYRYTVDSTVMFTGVAANLTFYGHTGVSVFEVDCGQSGIEPPAGYTWL